MDAFKKKLLISILATIVSGCGGESSSSAVPGTVVSDEENVTVSFGKNSDGNYEAVRHMSWTNFGFGGILSTY